MVQIRDKKVEGIKENERRESRRNKTNKGSLSRGGGDRNR